MVNTDDEEYKKLKKVDKEKKLDKIIAKIDDRIADNQFYIETLNLRKTSVLSIKNNL